MNGLYWEGDIAFLLQGSGRAQTAFNFEVPCPFEPPKGPCDHRIDIRSELDPDLSRRFPHLDPLVQAMSPVPKSIAEKVPYLAETGLNIILATLARMSSPLRLPIAPFWSMPPDRIIRALELTNVQPLVLTGVQTTHRANLDRVIEAAPLLPRRLVLQGTNAIILHPEAQKIRTAIGQMETEDLVSLPWEAYGGQLLKSHMLKKE